MPSVKKLTRHLAPNSVITGIFLCLALSPLLLASEFEPAMQLANPSSSNFSNRPIELSVNATPTDYQDAISEIEQELGPYSSKLPQHLTSLGLLYQSQGDHDQASEVFRRAMHVARISEGLYTLNQIPILEKLIESDVIRGEWEDASDSHKYLFWLHQRNYSEDDPRMLPMLQKLSKWHLNAYTLHAGGALFEHLVNAHDLFELSIEIIRKNKGEHNLQLIDPLKGLLVTNYYLATYQASKASQIDTAMGTNSVAEKPHLEQYILNSFRKGKKSIADMHSIYSNNPDAPPGSEYEALVELGDWNLLFGRRNTAMDNYRDAYQKISAQDDHEEQLDTLFGAPKALPDLPLLKGKADTMNSSADYVLVQFDVAANGNARNIEIIEAIPEDNVRHRSRAKKILRTVKFRPRFENFEPVATQKMFNRFVFPDK